jgi:hypothetical protein
MMNHLEICAMRFELVIDFLEGSGIIKGTYVPESPVMSIIIRIMALITRKKYNVMIC